MENKSVRQGYSSSALYIIAAVAMVIDHIGMVFFPAADILRIIGRIAMPIFAFLLVEGFYHTKNLAKYAVRLFTLAVITEIPRDLLVRGKLVDMTTQSVLWTFLIGLLMMEALRRWSNGDVIPFAFKTALIISAALFSSILILADYHVYSILTILMFYYTRDKNLKSFLVQVFGMLFINCFLCSSRSVEVWLPGGDVAFPMQFFAIFALPAVWQYNGEKGASGSGFKFFKYAFYPGHLAVLGLIKQF